MFIKELISSDEIFSNFIVNKKRFTMKILKYIYVFMLVVCSAFSFWVVNNNRTEQSDFLLRNVEALANEEGQNKYYCIGEGKEICPITGYKVRVVYTLSK